MHIALLTSGLYPYVIGGIQRHSQMLAEHLARLGVQVTVFHSAHEPMKQAAQTLAGLPTDPWRFIRTEFVEYPRRGRHPGHYVRDSHRYSEAVLERYRASKISPDFIYAQGLTGIAFVDARKHGVISAPVGINLHGYEMFQRAFGVRGRLEQLILRPTVRQLNSDADFIISFSGGIRRIVEDVLRVPPSRVLCLPNAVDPLWIKATPSLTRGKRRFLFVGRAERRKALPELHQAISGIPSETADFHFVGPMPLEYQLRRENITYHGAVTELESLQRLFDSCDVLMCPSYAEGMPTVILEAMARGLAILATDVGAISEMVDASNGVILARPRVSAIREAISHLAHIPAEDLAMMKRASLARAQLFSWDEVAKATAHSIHEAVQAGPLL